MGLPGLSRFRGAINFVLLENTCKEIVERNAQMAESLRRLEMTIASLAQRDEVKNLESRLKNDQSHASRKLEVLDAQLPDIECLTLPFTHVVIS